MILMVNVINLLDNFNDIVSKLKSSLKPTGLFAIVQWDAEKLDHQLADWEEDRSQLPLRSTLRMIYDANCEVDRVEHFLPVQNFYFCRPIRPE